MGSAGEDLVGVLRRGRQEEVVNAEKFAFKKDLQGHAEAKPSLYHGVGERAKRTGLRLELQDQARDMVWGSASTSTVSPAHVPWPT